MFTPVIEESDQPASERVASSYCNFKQLMIGSDTSDTRKVTLLSNLECRLSVT